jgi:hypothetical protein
MLKKILLLAAAIIYGCGSGGGGNGAGAAVSYECGSGNGTRTSPYTICDAAGLETVRDNLSGYYQLADDIILTGGNSPIGTRSAPFRGAFNGNGYVIYNLAITGGDYLGLFGYISGGAVSNLKLESVSITGNNYVGMIAGRIDSGSITNCSAEGVINAKNEVGGISGYISGSEIEKVSVSGNLTAGGAAGGIAGSAVNSLIINSYSEAAVSSKNYFGGLVGSFKSGSLSLSYAAGNLISTDSAGTNAGGLIGYAENAAISANFALNGRISAQRYVNRIAGNAINCDEENNFALNMPLWGISDGGIRGTTVTEGEAGDINTYINTGWDFSTVWEFPSPAPYPVLR